MRTKGGGNRPACTEVVKPLRDAIETIENDALSRGAEQMDRDTVMALFDSDEDQATMAEVQDSWDEARKALFSEEPPPSPEDVARVLTQMRTLNYSFMKLGTRRFHELVKTRWAAPAPSREIQGALIR